MKNKCNQGSEELLLGVVVCYRFGGNHVLFKPLFGLCHMVSSYSEQSCFLLNSLSPFDGDNNHVEIRAVCMLLEYLEYLEYSTTEVIMNSVSLYYGDSYGVGFKHSLCPGIFWNYF